MTKITNKNALTILEKRLVRNNNTTIKNATKTEIFNALISLALDKLLEIKARHSLATSKNKQRTVHYISIEYLIGKNLKTTLCNLEMEQSFKVALQSKNIDINEIYELEADAAIGNGGLGRLAACFMESLATLNYRAVGHCILYDYGLFKQKIINNEQREFPDEWIHYNESWLMPRNEDSVIVKFGGDLTQYVENGNFKYYYSNCEEVVSVPYDLFLSGYDSKAVSTLRLWSAKSKNKFDNTKFSKGDFASAMADIDNEEAISKVLYPADDNENGKLLRLKQQYFLTSSAIQDIVRDYVVSHKSFKQFAKNIAIHINDTHPALSIPELMRILLDEYNLSWNEAWDITNQTISYTNHTVLVESLECWNLSTIEHLLPRIAMIIKEIDNRFKNELITKYPNDFDKVNKMGIICNGVVKMANLSIVGSYKVNGVSKIHSDILKNTMFKDFSDFYPNKFLNVTNGVSHRRWLAQCNPLLNKLIEGKVSNKYLKNPQLLQKLSNYVKDHSVLKEMDFIKYQNKKEFAEYLFKAQGIEIDPTSRFDVHVKRIHEYKRQLLNVLKIIYLYEDLKKKPNQDMTKQIFIFGGKSAPAYYMAKRIIRLINDLATQINNDKSIKNKIKVVYVENFNVSISELLMPATDVTEQISLAGKEASGTGNMKAVLNGGLMLGTIDGANIEICDKCGYENSFMFGLKADQVDEINKVGYNPMKYYENNKKLHLVIESLIKGFNGESYKDIADYLLHQGDRKDNYMCLADFDSYLEAHYLMDNTYKDKLVWQSMALKNISNMGYFSSDRSINDYVKNIWKLDKIK